MAPVDGGSGGGGGGGGGGSVGGGGGGGSSNAAAPASGGWKGGKGGPKQKLKVWLRGLPGSMTEEEAKQVWATTSPPDPPTCTFSVHLLRQTKVRAAFY